MYLYKGKLFDPIVQYGYNVWEQYFERRPQIAITSKPRLQHRVLERMLEEAEDARATGYGARLLQDEEIKKRFPNIHRHKKNALVHGECNQKGIILTALGLIFDYATGSDSVIGHEMTHYELFGTAPYQDLFDARSTQSKLAIRKRLMRLALIEANETVAYAFAAPHNNSMRALMAEDLDITIMLAYVINMREKG